MSPEEEREWLGKLALRNAKAIMWMTISLVALALMGILLVHF